jgi:transcription elongation factor Elf1
MGKVIKTTEVITLAICPLCNQLESANYSCKKCSSFLLDGGRLMDYFDDYSAYLDIDGMKQFDGINNDGQKNLCPHMFYCSMCGSDEVKLISEANR